MGSVKGGSATIGYRYYMTIHFGIGRGPVDEIVAIKVGDKTAWPLAEGTTGTPDTAILDDRVTSINADNLFGGDKSEGGIKGSLTVCMGKATQIFPPWVKSLMGGRVPDFRGVCTMVFDGLICSLNPYPKTWKIRVRRSTKGWDGDCWQPSLATIVLADLSGNEIRAMNPAHILYECATNRDWGRGLSRSLVNESAWLAAATTLFNEGFGLCIRWNRQDKLDSFVQEVIDHIGATIYTDRETGLLTLKLIRDDYDVNALPTFDYNSGLLSVDDDETASQGEAITEVIVKYHDPVADEDRETRAQNLALMQSLGAANTSTADYSGAPTLNLASRLAQRDLKAQSAQVKRYKVTLDRRAWRIYPGAVFRISAADKGISNVVLRAGKFNDGTLTAGSIQVEAVLDVFGLSADSFVQQQPSDWVPPDLTPLVVSNRFVREGTYYDLFRNLSPADLALFDEHSGVVATVGVKPSNTALAYSIATRTGSDDFVDRTSESFAPMLVTAGVTGVYGTSVTFVGGVDLGLVLIGTLAQIGNEIVKVTDITLNADLVSGVFSYARGCIDTIPENHASGTKVFFIDQTVGTDGVEYATSEVVDVKLLTRTSSAELSLSLAPLNSVTIAGRQGRPYPPGNVTVGGTPAFNNPAVGANFSVAWAHRDRVVQQDQIVSHTDGNVGPETGTTYNLRFYSPSNALLASYTSIAANFKNFTAADTALTGAMSVELESIRDGLTSFMKYRFPITRS